VRSSAVAWQEHRDDYWDDRPSPAAEEPSGGSPLHYGTDEDGMLAGIAGGYMPVDWHDAWKDQPEDTAWLYREWLEAGTVNALFAKPGTGKSLVALEIAVAVTARGLSVVYVDDENRVRDLVERLQAFGCEPGDLARLHMFSFAGLPPLDTEKGGQHLLALATFYDAALITLDTTTRMVQGRENDSDTFLQLYRCSLVPLKARGMTVLRLDHPGKDAERGQRGSSAKDGDVDTIWQLLTETEGLEYRLERTKSRSGHGPAAFSLRRRYEPLRHDWNCPQDDPVSKIAGQLSDLGIPRKAGRPTVRRALEAAGVEVSNAQLTAAIRLRKTVPDSPGTVGTVSDDAGNCPPLPHVGGDSGQSPVPPPPPARPRRGKTGTKDGAPACPDCGYPMPDGTCRRQACRLVRKRNREQS